MHLRKFLLFLGLSVADLCLTRHLLCHADGQVYEGNPLARWWLFHYGWQGLTLFKLAVSLFVVGVTLVIARHRPLAAGRVLVVSCGILAVVVLYSGFLAGAVAARCPGGGLDDEIAATLEKSQYLDLQLRQAELYHQLLAGLSADVVARRRSLPEAVRLLAETTQGHNPNWLRYLSRLYPDRSNEARLASNLIYCALCDFQEGNSTDEAAARRLAAEYRACYQVSFKLPDELAAPAVCRWAVLSDDPPAEP